LSFTANESIDCALPQTVNFTNTTAMVANLEFYWDFGVAPNFNSTAINQVSLIPL